ncbi:MAG: GH116 family glycosyl-hydrolase [Faecalibacterium sp.]
MPIYKKAPAVAFPLGGIGTGSVSITSDGKLCDWEIFNRPNKESINGFTHFAIKAEDAEKVLDCRVLQGDADKNLQGSNMQNGNYSWGYGFGPNRGSLVGMRHFRDTTMAGEFPIATIDYADPAFPGAVQMTAFNPFIPTNADDSSLPAAFFSFDVSNTTDAPLTYTLAFTCNNPFAKQLRNQQYAQPSHLGIELQTLAFDEDSARYGNLTIATDTSDADGAQDVSYQEYWYRGTWFDELQTFMNDFSAYGALKNRQYDIPVDANLQPCTIARRVTLAAGEHKTIKFLLAWYLPNCEKYWRCDDAVKPTWKNYYATQFASSREVAAYCFAQWNRLYGDTAAFKEALFAQSLPPVVLDAIQGNIAILKSSTCLRLSGGEFYGWEGVAGQEGSCEGSCTHVWTYAYALAFLFPALERTLRRQDYTYNYHDSGKMSFRTILPLGSPPRNFRACVDGQMGGIFKYYRDWKLSGDDTFLKEKFAKIKQSLAYAWSDENEDRWDAEKSGVLTGRQHHTLDMELFGASAWLQGFYLAALKAASEMAEYLGEADAAAEYAALFAQGKVWMEENLYNGKYYVQKVDLTDKAIIDGYALGETVEGGSYWNEETREIKYQIGDGCEIDQVLAAWHADLMGLGEIFDAERRKSALAHIYKLNFKCMRDFDNPCRVFCLDDEQGMIMCSWDESTAIPKIPILYSQETMCGFEYAAACNMLQCGMEEEALAVVAAVRDRYDGIKRNPYGEIECGSSYARSMASYSLLLAYSGFRYDLTGDAPMMGFVPLKNGRYFWSLEGAWGEVEIEKASLCMTVRYGAVSLGRFITPFVAVERVCINGATRAFQVVAGEIIADLPLKKGDVLQVVGKSGK